MSPRFSFAHAIVLSAAAIAGCTRSGKESPHVTLSSVDPVRSAFNADSGKVRAIFLASPT
jgi:hypothetical protein